uniref:Uncharacterized protein n=1 Tax=Rhizophora mucronata TaxID=61149 RepID=A0A2P2M1Z2_RHIMU
MHQITTKRQRIDNKTLHLTDSLVS